MTSPRNKIDYENLTDEQVVAFALRLEERKKEAIYIYHQAKETLRRVCADYDEKMLALNESRKVALIRKNSNHRGMD